MRRLTTEQFLAIVENNERRWAEHEREIESHAAEHQARTEVIRILKRETAPRDPTIRELNRVLPRHRLTNKRCIHADT